MREQLIEGFEYDLWANRKWLSVLPTFAEPDHAKEVFAHILRAQHIWLTRVVSEEEVAEPSEDLEEALESLHHRWVDLLRTCDPGAFVSYTNLSGQAFFNTVEQIARHVVNHGTYHRGQLRGLMDAQKSEGFEETDLIRYYRECSK